MANPGAMKNWEAQARTNSVLAGSLKALEERVEDLSDLLEWRDDVEMRFEEMTNNLTRLEVQLTLLESTTQRQAASKAAPKPQESRQSSRQGSRRPSFDAGSDPTLTTPRKGSAASVRPPSAVLGSSQALVTSSQTFGDSGSLGVPNLTSVEEGEEEDGDVPIKESWMKRMSDRMEDTLTTEVGLGRVLTYHLVATGIFTAAFVAMMLEATNNRNSDMGLAGLLALMCLVGTVMGFYASWKRSTLFMSLYACWQQMLVAVAAVFLMRVFDGFTKVTQFCALRSGAGLPDADCDMHELMALVRLAVGFLTTLVALTSSFVTMLLRDLLVGAEIKRGIFTSLPSLTMGAAKPKAGLGGKAGGVGGKGALGGGWGGGSAKPRALPPPRA